MMKILIAVLAILVLSCNRNGKSEPSGTDAMHSQTDSLPDLTVNPGATAVNVILDAVPGGWHLVTDAESGWTRDALDYFVYPQRRIDQDYPYIARGDYNCDGKQDIAALVTDSTGKPVRLAFIYGNDHRVDWWAEDMQGAALKNMQRQDFAAMREEKELKISLKCDAVEAEWFEKATQVIFWNGNKFENVWTAD